MECQNTKNSYVKLPKVCEKCGGEKRKHCVKIGAEGEFVLRGGIAENVRKKEFKVVLKQSISLCV